MKKIILLLSQLIVCSVVSNAQQAPPNWMWLDGSGGSSYQYGCGIGTDDSGFHYISGRFSGTITFNGSPSQSITQNDGNVTPFVGKFDESGNCLWLSQQPYGWDYPRGFCTDKALKNNEYVTGNTNSGAGLFVYKFDNLGNVKWKTYLGNNGNGYGSAPNGDGVAADSSGDVYVTGETGGGGYTFGDSTLTCGTNGFWPQDQEMFLTKLDKGGNFLWAVGADDANGATSYDVGRDVVLDKTAQYVFVCGGYQNTPKFHSLFSLGDIIAPTAAGGTSSFFVAKYDTAGNLYYVATATNAGIPWGSGFTSGVGAVNAVAVDSCDNVFVTGYYYGTAQFGPKLSLTESNSGGQPDGFVASCNSKGQWQWVEDIGSGISNAGDYGQTIALDKDNDVYVGGVVNGTANFGNGVSLTASSTQGSLFLAKYANSNGAVQWAQGPSGTSQTGVAGLAIDTQKFVYIDGTFNGSMTLGSTTINATTNEGNIFIAKLDTVPALYIVPDVLASYCPGSSSELVFTIQGTFNSSNVFTAQLSDSSGSFINAINIGDTISSTGGTILITIPDTMPPGSTYLIRVVSSNPATSSYVNGCGAYYQKNVYIDNFYVTIGAGGSIPVILTASPGTSICNGTADTITISGGHGYQWGNPATNDSVIIVNPTITTTYNVQVTKGVCTLDTSIVITVGTSTLATITPQSPTTCNGGNVTLNAPVVSGTTYIWSPSASLSSTSGNSVVANPTIETVYTVSGSNSGGCPALGTDTVFIGPAPPFSINPPSDLAITCAGQGITLTVSDTMGSGYVWTPTALVNPDTGNSIIATPYVTTTFSVSGRDSEGCYVTAYDTVSTKKGVNKPVITQKGDVLTSTATEGNQWYENGNEIGGATADSLVVPNAGCYWTSATNIVNGCSSLSDTICVTGINRLSISPGLLSIYPNPTGGEIYINISSSVAEVNNWNLQITDVLGRTVYTRLSLNYSNDIDLSNLASGVYFITVINNTARAVYPVVKQN